MSESGKNHAEQDVSQAIAEAWRAKQGVKSTAADLAALEASLLADIATFDQRAVTLSEKTAPARTTWADRDLGLPAIDIAATPARKPLSTAQGPAPVSSPAPAAGSGLLSRLRLQAQTRLEESESRQRLQGEVTQVLDDGLRLVFDFFHEFIQQLNIIHPPIGRTYALPGILEFSGLVWEQGFVDYRTHPQSAGAVFDVVGLSFQLQSPTPVILEREGPRIDSLRKILTDNGVVFACDEKRNQRRMVEKAIFSISPQVKSTVRWRADPENACICLETRNLERLGDLRYTLAPENLNHALCEEFGRLVLGEANRFREFVRY